MPGGHPEAEEKRDEGEMPGKQSSIQDLGRSGVHKRGMRRNSLRGKRESGRGEHHGS